MAWWEQEVQGIWKEHFENLHNVDTKELIILYVSNYDDNGESLSRIELEVRIRKLKNGKPAGKEEAARKIIKNWISLRIVQYGL